MYHNQGKGIDIKDTTRNYKRTSPGALSWISDHKSDSGVSEKLRNGAPHKRVQGENENGKEIGRYIKN